IGVLLAISQGIVAHESRIVPAERLCWSWSALRHGMRRWIALGLGIGLLSGIVFGLVLTLALAVRPDVLSGARAAGGQPITGALTPSRILATGELSGLINGAGVTLT